MFPTAMDEQKEKLAATLKVAVLGASNPEKLLPALEALGRRHAAYDITAQHFDAVGAALLHALGDVAGPLWTDELSLAWAKTYGFIATTMIAAMEAQRAEDAASAVPSMTLGL
jgi:hemoglobin-like flavoprotein